LLFERYLTENCYSQWTHEEPAPGKRKTPDYSLRFGGQTFHFEVKEFDNDAPLADGEGEFYDPYRPLREKINQAVRQFKDYKAFPCSVVLADPNNTFVDIEAPEIVIGTMLGNIGYEMPIGANPGPQNQPRRVFTRGGKMVDAKRQRPQNTTISSIVVLSEYHVRLRRLQIEFGKLERQLGRKLTRTECLTVIESVPRSDNDEVLRVVVHENPYARIPFNREMCHGPFDERWGTDSGMIRRVFVGDRLAAFETALAKCDLRSPMQRLMDRQRK